jgi:hypothetical protein
MTAKTIGNPRIGIAITHKVLAAYMGYVHGDKEEARALADQLSRLTDGLAKTEPNAQQMPKCVSR